MGKNMHGVVLKDNKCESCDKSGLHNFGQYKCDSCESSCTQSADSRPPYEDISKFLQISMTTTEQQTLDELEQVQADEIVSHFKIGGNHKDHKCVSCGKSFTRATNLRTHIKNIHKGHKDYKCDSCGKSFSQSENLKRHIKILHEGQKNYKCDSCGKSFTQSGDLNIHIKTIHEGQRNYKCDYCLKSFTQSGHLKIHINASRNHKCNSCCKAFKNPENLKNHIMRDHSEQVSDDHQSLENPTEVELLNQVTDCYFCDEIFNIENDLEKHLRSNHQKELIGVD